MKSIRRTEQQRIRTMVRFNQPVPVLNLLTPATAYSIGDSHESNGHRVEFADHLELRDIENINVSSIHGAVSALLSIEPGGNETLKMDDSINLLKRVTTNVRGYDPFAGERPARFIPVLEARGIDDNDKNDEGHRKDTMPIANAVADREGALKTVSAVFQFLEESMANETLSNAALKTFLVSNVHGIIVRNNPGTLSAHSQKKFDNMLRELSDAGVMMMSHPDVMSTLGAKDVSSKLTGLFKKIKTLPSPLLTVRASLFIIPQALVKIKDLNCGLEDTEVYYDPESFIEGFRKSLAFQPRVIKQNRGSQGEGIWIVKLKDENYCSTYGECIVSLDAEIVLMEAWDNHIEIHTVGEFLEFCIHGRTEYSGVWTSTGQGRYFEGGIEVGAMMVDQRFLPRIVEGEVRCLFVGSELVDIVHKKPKEGGLSATLASGAIYTKYAPDAEKFASLVGHLKKDVPRIMESFDMSDRPLPLLWAADYIYGDTEDDLYIGEINCSCPGITTQLEIVPIIARVAIETVFPEANINAFSAQR